MRIGIVLFGHLRSYKQTISSFENLKNQVTLYLTATNPPEV